MAIFDRVLDEYRRMEPDGTDTWNPLQRDRELYHRMILSHHLCHALRRFREKTAGAGRGFESMKILDAGCGNGRSTRMYLEFGFAPRQICGVDLRPAALAMARTAHPSISYLQAAATLPFCEGAFDWISLCTVASSLTADARARLASELQRVLRPGGAVFFFDRPTAHVFAGDDPLDAELFPRLQSIWTREDDWPPLDDLPAPPLRAFLLFKP